MRVEAFEQQQNIREAKRRFRMHVAWASAVAVLVLIIAIILAKNRKAVGRQVGSVTEGLAKLGDIAEDVVVPARLKPSPTEDPYLKKLFDEL